MHSTPTVELMEVDEPAIEWMEVDEPAAELMDVDEPAEVAIPVVPLTAEQIVKIAMDTTGQSSNPKWFAYRRNRITGSLFGKVLSAVNGQSARAVADLKASLKGDQDLSYLEPIKWGKANEECAIASYCHLTGRTVKPTGIWLFPSGQLGASPDGLVFEHPTDPHPSGILEVKCPFYVRNLHYLEMRKQRRLPRYLTPSMHLNDTHDYYHQVQGELFATHAPWCDFVMWTTRSTLITRVFPNSRWADENIAKLSAFYEREIKNN